MKTTEPAAEANYVTMLNCWYRKREIESEREREEIKSITRTLLLLYNRDFIIDMMTSNDAKSNNNGIVLLPTN